MEEQLLHFLSAVLLTDSTAGIWAAALRSTGKGAIDTLRGSKKKPQAHVQSLPHRRHRELPNLSETLVNHPKNSFSYSDFKIKFIT